MQVDGFTLLAQVVNFLLLVYLLKRFLYHPIIAAIDRREAAIAARLAAAEQLQQDAAAERERYQQEQQQLAAQRQQWLDQARDEAATQRQEQLSQARHEVEQTRQQWLAELQREQSQFLHELRRQMGTELCALARQALADMADVELQDQLIAVFLRQLRELPAAQRAGLADAKLSVVTALPLDPARQERMQSALQQILQNSSVPACEQQPDLICGIVLRTPQGELGWDLSEYLGELSDRLRERMDNYAIGADNEPADSAERE